MVRVYVIAKWSNEIYEISNRQYLGHGIHTKPFV